MLCKEQGLPAAISFRPWQDQDSVENLTQLLHDAFAQLKCMQLNCSSGLQPAEVTLARLRQGHSFVAELDGQLIGTLSVYDPHSDSDAIIYRQPDVASVHQFAVDPAWQCQGVGNALLVTAITWAKSNGYQRLALDTPQPADHLISYYCHKGFLPSERLRFSGRDYESMVLSKSVPKSIAADT